MRSPLFLSLLLAAGPLQAQGAGDSADISGRWEACFTVDSVSVGGLAEICGVLTFGADTICGAPALVYSIPFDTLFTGSPSNRRVVAYQLAGDTLSISGGTANGARSGECVISSHDGSLYGTVIRQEGEWAGVWGILSYADAGPIGLVVMKRRWNQ